MPFWVHLFVNFGYLAEKLWHAARKWKLQNQSIFKFLNHFEIFACHLSKNAHSFILQEFLFIYFPVFAYLSLLISLCFNNAILNFIFDKLITPSNSALTKLSCLSSFCSFFLELLHVTDNAMLQSALYAVSWEHIWFLRDFFPDSLCYFLLFNLLFLRSGVFYYCKAGVDLDYFVNLFCPLWLLFLELGIILLYFFIIQQ